MMTSADQLPAHAMGDLPFIACSAVRSTLSPFLPIESAACSASWTLQQCLRSLHPVAQHDIVEVGLPQLRAICLIRFQNNGKPYPKPDTRHTQNPRARRVRRGLWARCALTNLQSEPMRPIWAKTCSARTLGSAWHCQPD